MQTPSYITITPNWPHVAKVKAQCIFEEKPGFMQLRSPYFSPIKYREHIETLPQDNPMITLARIEQHHDNKCIEASKYGFRPKADACYTTQNALACSVVVADCIPVLLTHKTRPWIAAIHAGWRGLHKEIIRHSIAKCPYPANEVQAWIGPSICKKCYDVGENLVSAFTKLDKAYAHYFSYEQNSIKADLSSIAKYQLQTLGIEDITHANICTFTHNKLPSYRRDANQSGRLLCAIWREDL